MFFTIFEDLCAKKGKTPTAVGNELGIAKTTISYWRNKSGVIPKQDVILKLSEYFGVSTDYLLSGEEPATKKPLPENEERLKELYELTADLTEDEVNILRAFAAGLKANHKND